MSVSLGSFLEYVVCSFPPSSYRLTNSQGIIECDMYYSVLTSGILWWEIWTRCCWSYQRFQYRWTRQAGSRQSVHSTYIRGPVLRWVWTQGPYYVLWQELQSKYVSLTKFSLYLVVTDYFNNLLYNNSNKQQQIYCTHSRIL